MILNNEGWILTAAHIFDQFETLLAQETSYNLTEEERVKINESNSPQNVKRKMLAALPKYGADHTVNCSIWLGDGVTVAEVYIIPAADIALARLENLDTTGVPVFPTFKDPSKDYVSGASLCKLGFPFHTITPVWDAPTQGFHLPAGAVPIPYFPMEGIFTRVANIAATGPAPPYPLMWVETSSPGLRGQSGGPIFDTQGTIWAIQVNTAHFPLGFNAKVSPAAKDTVPQFLNVGRGVHMETVLGLLNEHGVHHVVSAY